MTASAPRLAFTRLNSPACAYPYRRLAAALASGRRTARGHRDSLDLRRRAFSSPSPDRFIPALSIGTTSRSASSPSVEPKHRRRRNEARKAARTIPSRPLPAGDCARGDRERDRGAPASERPRGAYAKRPERIGRRHRCSSSLAGLRAAAPETTAPGGSGVTRGQPLMRSLEAAASDERLRALRQRRAPAPKPLLKPHLQVVQRGTEALCLLLRGAR